MVPLKPQYLSYYIYLYIHNMKVTLSHQPIIVVSIVSKHIDIYSNGVNPTLSLSLRFLFIPLVKVGLKLLPIVVRYNVL